MLRVAIKGLLTHKLRLLLSAMSIALGVSFVAGTLVLTDALNSSFTQAYDDQYAGVDLVVRKQAAFSDSEALDQRQPVPASVLSGVRRVPGVAEAEGSVTGFAMMVDRNNKAIGSGALATNAISTHVNADLASALSYRSGRAPTNGTEVAIDADTANKSHVRLGDRMQILFRGPPGTFTVVGFARFGDNDSLGGATTALFDTATAQRVLGKQGRFDSIDIKAAAGTTVGDLRQRVSASLGKGLEATTGEDVAKEGAKIAKGFLTGFNIFLLVFAGIAVFVGSFIIWNTFSILVAQRSRELALLRAIGASRRQVLRSVLLESLVVGLLASVVGLAFGLVLARGLVILLEAFGLDVPGISNSLPPRTIIVGLLVGTVVTLVASIAPARKATHIAPVEALRESTPGGYTFSHRRAVIGTVVTAAGAAALGAGLFADKGPALVGLGALVTFLGVSTLLPLVSRVLARAIGAPLSRIAGTSGRLAQENAMRNPKRTASTAAALMIGLALVASVSVLASSLKTSISSDIDRTARADLIVQQAGGNGFGLSPSVAAAIRKDPGVAAVSELAEGRAKIDGSLTYVAPVDPATVEQALDLGVRSGKVADLASGGVFVYDKTAKSKGWKVGDTIPVEWAQTGAERTRVVGTFSEKGAPASDYLFSLATYDRNVAQRLDTYVFVNAVPGADLSDVQNSVIQGTRTWPNAEVLTADEFKDSISGQIDKVLLFIEALLLLAVVIALLGIVNTLALSVFERTRELGLLRAVGMTRRQMRAMVRWESVIVALIGALTGAAIGVAFGVALSRALRDDGVPKLDIPVRLLAIYVVAAGVAGVLAAVGPARRAAKVDVLRAVVTE